MVELREITRSNWLACARLEPAPGQEGFLAPNVYSIAEWHFEPHYRPRAVCVGDEVVGFLMYCMENDPSDAGTYWLFRLMIDARHQGKGYAWDALRLAIEEMKAAGASRIRTMHKPENVTASRLYRRARFVEVGFLDDGDVELELDLLRAERTMGNRAMSPVYRLRLMFEWGGGCLWCANDAAREKFDVGSIEDALPLSASTQKELQELSAWHDQALDWTNPAGASLWGQDDFDRFDLAAQEMKSKLEVELGPQFEIAYVSLGPENV